MEDAFTVIGGFLHEKHGQVLAVLKKNAATPMPESGMRVELHYPDGTSSQNIIKMVGPFNRGRMSNTDDNMAIGLTFASEVGPAPEGTWLRLV